MPWQLGRSQTGLRGAAGEEGESGSKNPRSLPGAGDPPGEREALPEGSCAHWALLGAGDEAPSGSLIGPPQAGAAGYLGAQARGALSQPPDSRASQPARAPRPHLLGWESLASCSAPPLPPAGTVWHRPPGSRLLRRTRPAQLCAQACVSGTETTRDPEEAGSACHPGGGGWGTAAGAAGRWGRSRLFWACTRATSSPHGTWETAARSVPA